jgi:hypothetical protein
LVPRGEPHAYVLVTRYPGPINTGSIRFPNGNPQPDGFLVGIEALASAA